MKTATAQVYEETPSFTIVAYAGRREAVEDMVRDLCDFEETFNNSFSPTVAFIGNTQH